MNRLLAVLRPGAARAACPSRAPDQRTHTDAGAGPFDRAQPEPPGACGWFDSSHALQHGLRVTEHASADAVASELPLADWLQLHLGGWSAPRDAEVPRHAGLPAH